MTVGVECLPVFTPDLTTMDGLSTLESLQWDYILV